jgi:hypothetical protein
LAHRLRTGFEKFVGATEVKYTTSRGPSGARIIATLVALTATYAGSAARAMAAVDLTASAAVNVEHNSNPIELSSNEAFSFAPGGKSQLDDTSRVVTATVGAGFGSNGPLHAGLQALYSHTESQRFNKLGHSDYNIGGDVAWKPGHAFDMSLTGSRSRSPIRQADATGEETTQKTTSYASSTLRLRPTEDWQLALKPSWTHVELPLAGAPNYRYRESAGSVAIGFLGAGRLVPGVELVEAKTTSSGVGGAADYRQRTVSGTLNYQTKGFSTFALSIGQTRRVTDVDETASDPTAKDGTDSGLSGSLSYQRKLSPKTSFNISAFRAYQLYDAGLNLTVDTGFSFGVSWAATRKLTVALKSDNVWSHIDAVAGGVEVTGADGTREDMVRAYSLNLGYLAARHISVDAYATRRVRRSEVWAAQFNSTIFGLGLTAKLD